jgi:adenylate cyclase
LALQALWLPRYRDLLEVLERARPGVTVRWPQSVVELAAGRKLELTVAAIRRAFESDPRLAAAARAAIDRGNYSEDRARALRALLDAYAGPASRYFNLYGPARSLRTIPYDQALSGQGDVAGKIVFVGFSEPRQPTQADYFYSVFSEQTGINLSGVELGATALANLIDRRALEPLPLPWHVLVVFAFGMVFGVLVGGGSMRRAIGALVGGAVLYVAIAYWLFAAHDIWLPLVVPLLVQMPAAFAVALWWNYREVAAQRERVRTALGYYVPRAVARRLAAATTATGANRQLLHGTCLVTDAEQYTAVAERLRPDDLATLMNDYYGAIFRVVQTHGGEVSDTAGDSMVAVWASAQPDATARLRAAQAALAIVTAVERFNELHPEQRLPTRIGLESGELVIGDVGAEQRYEYRAIGDIVNTAARIQALSQLLGTRVLASGATIEGTTGLRTRGLGAFLLRGKRLPVEVHELLASAGGVDDDGLAAFAIALAAFRTGSWHEAADRFAALAARFPNDGPSRYYAALAAAYRREPPNEWRGAVRVDVK